MRTRRNSRLEDLEQRHLLCAAATEWIDTFENGWPVQVNETPVSPECGQLDLALVAGTAFRTEAIDETGQPTGAFLSYEGADVHSQRTMNGSLWADSLEDGSSVISVDSDRQVTLRTVRFAMSRATSETQLVEFRDVGLSSYAKHVSNNDQWYRVDVEAGERLSLTTRGAPNHFTVFESDRVTPVSGQERQFFSIEPSNRAQSYFVSFESVFETGRNYGVTFQKDSAESVDSRYPKSARAGTAYKPLSGLLDLRFQADVGSRFEINVVPAIEPLDYRPTDVFIDLYDESRQLVDSIEFQSGDEGITDVITLSHRAETSGIYSAVVRVDDHANTHIEVTGRFTEIPDYERFPSLPDQVTPNVTHIEVGNLARGIPVTFSHSSWLLADNAVDRIRVNGLPPARVEKDLDSWWQRIDTLRVFPAEELPQGEHELFIPDGVVSHWSRGPSTGDLTLTFDVGDQQVIGLSINNGDSFRRDALMLNVQLDSYSVEPPPLLLADSRMRVRHFDGKYAAYELKSPRLVTIESGDHTLTLEGVGVHESIAGQRTSTNSEGVVDFSWSFTVEDVNYMQRLRPLHGFVYGRLGELFQDESNRTANYYLSEGVDYQLLARPTWRNATIGLAIDEPDGGRITWQAERPGSDLIASFVPKTTGVHEFQFTVDATEGSFAAPIVLDILVGAESELATGDSTADSPIRLEAEPSFSAAGSVYSFVGYSQPDYVPNDVLFAVDNSTNELLHLDPQSGVVLRRVAMRYPTPLARTYDARVKDVTSFAYDGTELIVSHDSVLVSIDPETGMVTRQVGNGFPTPAYAAGVLISGRRRSLMPNQAARTLTAPRGFKTADAGWGRDANWAVTVDDDDAIVFDVITDETVSTIPLPAQIEGEVAHVAKVGDELFFSTPGEVVVTTLTGEFQRTMATVTHTASGEAMVIGGDGAQTQPDVDAYTFSARPNQLYHVQVDGVLNLPLDYMRIEVRDASGQLLGSTSTDGQGRLDERRTDSIAFRNPNNELSDVTISVISSQVGTYAITVTETKPVDFNSSHANPLEAEQPLYGHLRPATERLWVPGRFSSGVRSYELSPTRFIPIRHFEHRPDPTREATAVLFDGSHIGVWYKDSLVTYDVDSGNQVDSQRIRGIPTFDAIFYQDGVYAYDSVSSSDLELHRFNVEGPPVYSYALRHLAGVDPERGRIQTQSVSSERPESQVYALGHGVPVATFEGGQFRVDGNLYWAEDGTLESFGSQIQVDLSRFEVASAINATNFSASLSNTAPFVGATRDAKLLFSKRTYALGESIDVILADADRSGEEFVDVFVQSETGDEELVRLLPAEVRGTFRGQVSLTHQTSSNHDGTLTSGDDRLITASYLDDDDGDGNQRQLSTRALIKDPAYRRGPEFQFEATAGEAIRVQLDRVDISQSAGIKNDLEVAVAIYDPSGTLIDVSPYQFDELGQVVVEFEALVDGQHTAQLARNAGYGEYLISLTNPDPHAVSIETIDRTCLAVATAQVDEELDFDGNGILDAADVDWLLTNGQIPLGDVNLDSHFNSSDLVTVFTQNEYEDGVPANSVWSRGDWNCDGEFDSSDLVTAFRRGGYVLAARENSRMAEVPFEVSLNQLAAAIASDDGESKKAKTYL